MILVILLVEVRIVRDSALMYEFFWNRIKAKLVNSFHEMIADNVQINISCTVTFS